MWTLVSQSGILDDLLGGRLHMQVLSRVDEFFKYLLHMRRFDASMLAQLWRSAENKHETEVRVVYERVMFLLKTQREVRRATPSHTVIHAGHAKKMPRYPPQQVHQQAVLQQQHHHQQQQHDPSSTPASTPTLSPMPTPAMLSPTLTPLQPPASVVEVPVLGSGADPPSTGQTAQSTPDTVVSPSLPLPAAGDGKDSATPAPSTGSASMDVISGSELASTPSTTTSLPSSVATVGDAPGSTTTAATVTSTTIETVATPQVAAGPAGPCLVDSGVADSGVPPCPGPSTAGTDAGGSGAVTPAPPVPHIGGPLDPGAGGVSTSHRQGVDSHRQSGVGPPEALVVAPPATSGVDAVTAGVAPQPPLPASGTDVGVGGGGAEAQAHAEDSVVVTLPHATPVVGGAMPAGPSPTVAVHGVAPVRVAPPFLDFFPDIIKLVRSRYLPSDRSYVVGMALPSPLEYLLRELSVNWNTEYITVRVAAGI